MQRVDADRWCMFKNVIKALLAIVDTDDEAWTAASLLEASLVQLLALLPSLDIEEDVRSATEGKCQQLQSVRNMSAKWDSHLFDFLLMAVARVIERPIIALQMFDGRLQIFTLIKFGGDAESSCVAALVF